MRVGVDGRNAFKALLQQLPQHGGTRQHIAVLALSHHLGQIGTAHQQPVARQHIVAQRRTLLLAHWRQLGGVAHKQQTAPLARIDVAHKVVHQLARAKQTVAHLSGATAYHRCLVHHEQGMA